MPDTEVDWRQLRRNLRLLVGLKVNKVWPWAACRIIWGWSDGGRVWRS